MNGVNTIYLYALGFIGQGLFGSRLIIQWWLTEKKGKVVSPIVFWYLSLFGSIVFLVYGILRNDPVIVFGQTISFYIYARNLHLLGVWTLFPKFARIICLSIPLLLLLAANIYFPNWVLNHDENMLLHPIMLIGTIGQLALNLRFLYQWYFAEKYQTSVLPYGFWWISVWASVMVIVYSLFHPVHKIEPVLLVSQTFGIIPYIRNMMISRRAKSVTDV
jgi:lipid-A-disaccharide synthase-like uncharacterized protein